MSFASPGVCPHRGFNVLLGDVASVTSWIVAPANASWIINQKLLTEAGTNAAFSTSKRNTGNWYAELVYTALLAGVPKPGFGVERENIYVNYANNTFNGIGAMQQLGGVCLAFDGQVLNNTANAGNLVAPAVGDVIQIALAINTFTPNSVLVFIGQNGGYLAGQVPATGVGGLNQGVTQDMRICADSIGGAVGNQAQITMRTKASEFSFAIPAGYSAWDT